MNQRKGRILLEIRVYFGWYWRANGETVVGSTKMTAVALVFCGAYIVDGYAAADRYMPSDTEC
jgi:hypothetical protein